MLKYLKGLSILFTIIGWLLNKKYKPILKIITPNYPKALKAYKDLSDNEIIKKGDSGFDAFCKILFKDEANAESFKRQKINQIELLHEMVMIQQLPRGLTDNLKLKICFDEVEPKNVQVNGLLAKIESVFLVTKLSRIGTFLFLVGIIAIVILYLNDFFLWF